MEEEERTNQRYAGAVTNSWWNAPAANGALNAEVALPGSKSQTVRALIIGASSAKPLEIRGALKCRDTQLALDALTQLGAQFIDGLFTPPASRHYGGTVSCGLAGTVMRFVPALVAFGSGTVRFEGDKQASRRPVAPLLDALEQLGAKVTYHDLPGQLPFSVTGRGNADVPIEVTLDSSSSSQFLSALLLASPQSPQAFQVRLIGDIPSAPHIQMTLEMLSDQEAPCRRSGEQTWMTPTAPIARNPINIEPDLSNAGPFLAAALIAGGSVTVPHWPAETTQAGDAWKWLLSLFGANVAVHDDSLKVTCDKPRSWSGIQLNLGQVGELVPTVAALCVFADSPSEITGIGHLRAHETDRLAALATEIRRVGGNATVLEDGIRIEPSKALHSADLESYGDHRMATFGALLGLALPGTRVQNVDTTSKTLPDFTKYWEAMLAGGESPGWKTLDE